MRGADHHYPPAEWTVEGLREALATDRTDDHLPRYDDADAWTAIATDSLTGPLVDSIRSAAARARDEPIDVLPASEYLGFERTGNRSHYQDSYFDRQQRLSVLALAECFERSGDFLDGVLDYAWATCEQTTWLLPAHVPEDELIDGLARPAPPDEHHVALFSARTALLLAEVDRLLGDRLHPALRDRIRREVDERVFAPYLAGDHHWFHPPVGNWNAVCNGAVITAALHLEPDRDRLARLVHRGVETLVHYLRDFDADGCTPEGIGYWNFGFGHYATLAAALEARTGGEYSLLSPPIVRKIAAYPLAVELSPGRYLPFSDADEREGVAPYAACWVGRRLDLPGLAARGRSELSSRSDPFFRDSAVHLSETLRNLVWARAISPEWDVPVPDSRTYFDGYDWWIARVDPTDPNGLVVAAKGGDNGEAHNHNDCGSFVVHFRGESLLTDLGLGTYDREYFGEARYDRLATRSLGHSVPYVDGCEQTVGSEYHATVLERTVGETTETFAVDLADCYPTDAGVESLRRRFRLDRDAGEYGVFTIEDEVRLAPDSEGTGWESVLVSYRPVRKTDRGVEIRGERGRATVDVEGGSASVDVEHLPEAMDSVDGESDEGRRDVWRTRVRPSDATALRLVVTPELE